MSAQINNFINSLATPELIFIISVISLALMVGLTAERISSHVSKIRITRREPKVAQAPPLAIYGACPECNQPQGQHLALCSLAPKPEPAPQAPGPKKARAPCALCGSTGSNHFKGCPKRPKKEEEKKP